MDVATKLSILADAAKYDASCASSGSEKRNSRDGGIGSTSNGICHSYTPDGRCVSLLKILLTNFCTYDCQYCINRVSSDVRRARFTPEEVIKLTLDFYKRNYIEGLFLSSGIIRNPDYTMEQVVKVARTLREVHGFRGYIHLKTIPEAAPAVDCRGGALGRPDQHQRGVAHANRFRKAGAGEKSRAHTQHDGCHPRAHHAGEGGTAREPQGAAFFAGGAEHAE